MKFIKKLLAGAALVAAGFGSAQAVTVGGVTWDSTSAIDFSAASVSIHQFIDGTTGVVSGFGTINTLNGVSGFCSGCELTFQFGGFSPISGLLPSASGGTILYKNGFVNVYVDTSPEAVNNSALGMTTASTGDGELWLSLLGHNKINGSSFSGTVNLDSDGLLSTLAGGGLLDVTGGLAKAYLDSNAKNEGSDFAFSTSFTSFLVPNSLLDSIGTGNFNAKTVNQVPEPSSIALLGLGLAGLGFAQRRRNAAAK